jgi:hypothetical protein
LGSTKNPTAVHADGDEQATAFRKLLGDPSGFGEGCTVQAVPSQRSTRVSEAPDASV